MKCAFEPDLVVLKEPETSRATKATTTIPSPEKRDRRQSSKANVEQGQEQRQNDDNKLTEMTATHKMEANQKMVSGECRRTQFSLRSGALIFIVERKKTFVRLKLLVEVGSS